MHAPEGIPGVELTGPWPVGAYAVKLRAELRKRARVQLFGEVWNWRVPRPPLPRRSGVAAGGGGRPRDDVLAGLARRGGAGRLVWAFAPVQDRHAAPAITRALQDLAACGQVDVIVVARGGGSLADLFCFCDETLCRTVAMLPVPVIASVGHHTDRTLLDDVASASPPWRSRSPPTIPSARWRAATRSSRTRAASS